MRYFDKNLTRAENLSNLKQGWINGDLAEFSLKKILLSDAGYSQSDPHLSADILASFALDAVEPEAVLAPLLHLVELDGLVLKIPSRGASVASEIAEGTSIPEASTEQELLFHANLTKLGASISLTDENLRTDPLGILRLASEDTGRTIKRSFEQIISNEIFRLGQVDFDNNDSNKRSTNGVDFANAKNSSLSIDDVLESCDQMISRNYLPDTLLVNPRFLKAFRTKEWREWLEDGIPRLRLVASRFAPHYPSTDTVDLAVLDSNNIGMLFSDKAGMRTTKWKVPIRDINRTSFLQRLGVGVLHDGRGISLLKGITTNISVDSMQVAIYPAPTGFYTGQASNTGYMG